MGGEEIYGIMIKKGNEMNYEDIRFKIGISFSGKYREHYVEPVCNALLRLGYQKNEIFYDFWHESYLNGLHGDDKLQQVFNKRCDCVVVLLSPDYREKNWTGHTEWPAIKEIIRTGEDEKLCLLGINKVEIDKIDGLYINQAIVKFIDSMRPEDVADFINTKYLQIAGQRKADKGFRYTYNVLEETRFFIEELSSLTVEVSKGNKINIIEQLKDTPREGKRIRLAKLKDTIIKPRSVFDHMISLAYLADIIGPFTMEKRWNASEMARLIAYHEIAEAIIGDIASHTVDEPVIKGPDRVKMPDREIIVNKFISLYADEKQKESIGYLNNRIKPSDRVKSTRKTKSELKEQMDYFKAFDHLDCLVAIWRYLFFYRNSCTPAQLTKFIDIMSDFFTNERLKEDMLITIPVFKTIISVLADKADAKRYVNGSSIKQLFNAGDSVTDAMIYLIEDVPLFFEN